MNISWLQTFYIVGAISLLAVAIILYPTLRDKKNKVLICYTIIDVENQDLLKTLKIVINVLSLNEKD